MSDHEEILDQTNGGPDVADSTEPDHGYWEHESLKTSTYILRGTDFRAGVRDSLRATPWWVVSVALHIAAALILAKVVSLPGPTTEEGDVTLNVNYPHDDPELPNFDDLIPFIDDIVRPDTEPPTLAPVLGDQPDIEMDDTSDPRDGMNAWEYSDPEGWAPSVDQFGEIEGDDIGSLAGGPEAKVAVAHNFTSQGHTSYDTIISDLSVRLGTGRRRSQTAKNVLLIWIMDASVSMKDDQEAIRERLWEIDSKFREREGAGDLKQAVIYYSDRPHLWLKPTSDVDAVMEAVENIEVSPPGTIENTMAAIMFAASRFRSLGTGAGKVAVLVDDDSPDDSARTEEALRALKQARMQLFVINRECPFQSQNLLEHYRWVDEDGEEYSGRGLVHRGPETALPEISGIGFGGFSWGHWGSGASDRGRIMSGFGIYDISRLAYHTGGAYYILDPDAEKAPYDWDFMESYRPELVSRAEYERRTSRNPYKRSVRAVTKQWNSKLPAWGWFGYPQAREMLTKCEKKLAEADRVIKQMERDARMPEESLGKLKSMRRWPANADLVWASLVLAKHRLRQYQYGLTEFLRQNRSIPEGHVITVSGVQEVRETEAEKVDRAAVIRAMRFVANRHPRTPWGNVASSFDPNSNRHLYGVTFGHRYYFHPYWAKFVLRDGRSFEGYVTELDKKRGLVSFSRPGHGSKARIRISRFRSIERIESNRPYNPYERI